jgi:hypothetical protein
MKSLRNTDISYNNSNPSQELGSLSLALEEDIPQLVAFGYRSYDENLLSYLNCPTHFGKAAYTLTQAVQAGLVLVKRNVENAKLLDGTLCLGCSTVWFSELPILAPLLFYIKEEHRSFKLAKAFLSSAKEYAIINRIPIVFDLFAQKDVEKKKKLLIYLGFKDFGSSFVFQPT